MKLKCTFFFFILLSFTAQAQNLTGIWRGYFAQKNFDIYSGRLVEDKYKYEIQIDQSKSNSVNGIAYSYKNTTFYCKVGVQGLYTKKTKSIIIKELLDKILEKRIVGSSELCLMTCYLDYSKNNNVETLTGTYSSINVNPSRQDCGIGTVYLEKVEESLFKKEDFLLKKVPLAKPAIPQAKTTTPLKSNVTGARKLKPGAEDAFVETKKTKETPKQPVIEEPVVVTPPIELKTPEPKTFVPLPKILKDRSNNVAQTIEVDEGEVDIAIYDNGEIDHDTITVYHNNQVEVDHGGLSNAPIRIKLKVDLNEPHHEFVMVANNLGLIPPNTALMIINAGGKRYEVFLTSDEQKNAKVIIDLKKNGAKVK